MKPAYLWGIGVAAILLVSVFFLWNTEENLTHFPPKNEVIVAFGDSLVEGVGATPGNDFVSLLENRLGVAIINLGIAGDTTGSGLARVDEVLAYDPGTVLVLLGGNDALRRISPETTRENLGAIIKALQDEGVFVVLLGVRGGLVSDPYDAMYEELAETFGTAYVPNVLSGILLRSELTADQIHPNDAGYEIVADRIYETLAPLLNRK